MGWKVLSNRDVYRGLEGYKTSITPLPINLKMVEEPRIQFAKKNCVTPTFEAIDLIEKAIKERPDSSVSWSGGKCSTVILYMALQIKPDIVVNFNDTGVEFPETYEFIDRIVKEWGVNLVRLKPKTTFWACTKKYGFPQIRGKYQPTKRLHGKDGRPMCCQLLKEAPLLEAKIGSTITGLRVAESRMRTFGIAQHGQYYYATSMKRWQWHPIAFWTEDQVWGYHQLHNIPHNAIYEKGHFRCGCWPCTGYIEWEKYLSGSHPAMYKALMKIKGTPTLWEYEDQTCPLDGIES